jgi:cystathionine gamma-synthase
MFVFRAHYPPPPPDQALVSPGIWTLGESLGGVESLVEHPGAMTHASLDGSGFEVPDDLIRLSVGIEHPDDLERDLDAMLARAERVALAAR